MLARKVVQSILEHAAAGSAATSKLWAWWPSIHSTAFGQTVRPDHTQAASISNCGDAQGASEPAGVSTGAYCTQQQHQRQPPSSNAPVIEGSTQLTYFDEPIGGGARPTGCGDPVLPQLRQPDSSTAASSSSSSSSSAADGTGQDDSMPISPRLRALIEKAAAQLQANNRERRDVKKAWYEGLDAVQELDAIRRQLGPDDPFARAEPPLSATAEAGGQFAALHTPRPMTERGFDLVGDVDEDTLKEHIKEAKAQWKAVQNEKVQQLGEVLGPEVGIMQRRRLLKTAGWSVMGAAQLHANDELDELQRQLEATDTTSEQVAQPKARRKRQAASDKQQQKHRGEPVKAKQHSRGRRTAIGSPAAPADSGASSIADTAAADTSTLDTVLPSTGDDPQPASSSLPEPQQHSAPPTADVASPAASASTAAATKQPSTPPAQAAALRVAAWRATRAEALSARKKQELRAMCKERGLLLSHDGRASTKQNLIEQLLGLEAEQVEGLVSQQDKPAAVAKDTSS